ncbi:hypothetical protein [Nocardia fusca]|uniref:Uncharacterized protein n=1 Tax=Nocardia fusca TaxID=941183 RepID=A0ABV3FIP0_9NOCA
MTEHPIFRDDADQLTMISAVLDAFPGQAGSPDIQVPIHPRVRQAWAKALIQRGLVLVPDLMQELPVADGSHPEAGYLQPMTWMKREDYEAQAAQATAAPADPNAPDPAEQQKRQAEDILRAVKPSLADQIAAMSDPEKRAAMAAMAEQIPQHMNNLRMAQEQIEKARARAEEGQE